MNRRNFLANSAVAVAGLGVMAWLRNPRVSAAKSNADIQSGSDHHRHRLALVERLLSAGLLRKSAAPSQVHRAAWQSCSRIRENSDAGIR